MQIRLYDISQNVEIIYKQLSTNQITDIVAQSYHISNQLKGIFQRCKVPFLFALQRKMMITNVLISSILTERLDKPALNTVPCKCQLTPKSQATSHDSFQAHQPTGSLQANHSKLPRLGGVHLYNEAHRRGLSIEEAEDEERTRREGRHNPNNLERTKEIFVSSLME